MKHFVEAIDCSTKTHTKSPWIRYFVLTLSNQSNLVCTKEAVAKTALDMTESRYIQERNKASENDEDLWNVSINTHAAGEAVY